MISCRTPSTPACHPHHPYPRVLTRLLHQRAAHPASNLVKLGGIPPLAVDSRLTLSSLRRAGTPMIAEQKLLDVYPFFKAEHTFLRLPGEDEVAAMYRIMRMGEAEVMAKRTALAKLAEELTLNSMSVFRDVLGIGVA